MSTGEELGESGDIPPLGRWKSGAHRTRFFNSEAERRGGGRSLRLQRPVRSLAPLRGAVDLRRHLLLKQPVGFEGFSKTVRLTEYQDSMISNLSPMWFAANMIVVGALLFFGFIALFQLRPIASSILMAYAVFWTLTTSYDLLVLRRLAIPGSALTSTDLIGRGCIFIIIWSVVLYSLLLRKRGILRSASIERSSG